MRFILRRGPRSSPLGLATAAFRGAFVSLFLVASLRTADISTAAQTALLVAGSVLTGVGAAALVGRPRIAPWKDNLLLHVLELPVAVHGTLFVGTAVAAYFFAGGNTGQLLQAAGLGALGGLTLRVLSWIRGNGLRVLVSLLPMIALGLAYFRLGVTPAWPDLFAAQVLIAVILAQGIVLVDGAGDTEAEAAVRCAGLGLAAWQVLQTRAQPWILGLAVLVLYFVYVRNYLRLVRALPHLLRARIHANNGRAHEALAHFRRALEEHPRNREARQRLADLHGSVPLEEVERNPGTLALLDLNLCLERAQALLAASPPDESSIEKAVRFLRLAERKPELASEAAYWQAVARTHAGQFVDAAATLKPLLDGVPPLHDDLLFRAWQLALTLHPELSRLVGTPLLSQPGKRLEAIAVTERRLAISKDDAGAWDMKRVLYSGLTMGDYAAAPVVALDFDHAYVQQLGLGLLQKPDQQRRGSQYLELAARGLPLLAPGIYHQIARASEREGDERSARRYDELARKAGLGVGLNNLADPERDAFYASVRRLAETARSDGDVEAAIQHYALLAGSARSGIETMRTLADLYEKKGDVCHALRAVEEALLYNGRDADLLARKDRYYYSLMPADIAGHLEVLGRAFDVPYCVQKARSLLASKEPAVLEWAEHLAGLACAAQPESLVAQTTLARILRSRGDREHSIRLLEATYRAKPDRFASDADEEAWYQAARLLGESYLYELDRPDLAIACLTDFRKSPRSGADTLYKLGQAHEQTGDLVRARKCYEHVAAYDTHPLAPDAREALTRIEAS